MESYYWHDYETWGINPRTDRAAQFAGLRTDLDFNVIGKPLMIYAKPATDFLPDPGACMVTGLTPQEVDQHGLSEAEFFQQINAQFSQPATCVLGYNSLRFDDEFTRYGLYRNFIDPYAREWQNGNSRWDIIDLVRLTHALRPEGVNWPKNEDGSTSFRLEKLTEANGIEHEGAHDALSDVTATIELAKLIKQSQPRLFDYVFSHRDKNGLATMLNLHQQTPVLHVSSRYPASLGCVASVIPVARDTRNKNAIMVYDLRVDPKPMLELSAEDIHQRVFTAAKDLPEGVERIPLKMVHLNKAPVIVPLNTLTEESREKWQLDVKKEQQHAQMIRETTGLASKIQQVFGLSEFTSSLDPDQTLYDGFMSANDKRTAEQIQLLPPEQLRDHRPVFENPKFNTLFFRYKARNWPELLNKDEKIQWHDYRNMRLSGELPGGMTLQEYQKQLALLSIKHDISEQQRDIVNALLDWPEVIGIQPEINGE